ncbi:MAG: ribbon-helix-helix domain-containing protein [Acidobacteriota bacterium]
MSTAKVAITIDQATLAKLDRLIERKVFTSRSKAIQEAISDKLARIERGRLARECAKLDPNFEKALAEEGLSQELHEWPEY